MVFLFTNCSNPTSNKIESSLSTEKSSEIQSIQENDNVKEEKVAETNCDDNKRAYEFGREMATMVKLGSSSLQSAISEFAEPLGIEEPFRSSNPCVIKGFEDENKGIASPYNKEGKNWTNF
jgi:hypothetical protein